MTSEILNLHAGCVLLGEAGILIRGESGSGKSTLALRLIAERLAGHGFAALVADDRVLLSRHGGRLVARPHPSIAGMIEHHGVGIRTVPYEPAAVVRLIVDLATAPPRRMPWPDEARAVILGVALPRITGMEAGIDAAIEASMSWPR